jgi:hypothetical protein
LIVLIVFSQHLCWNFVEYCLVRNVVQRRARVKFFQSRQYVEYILPVFLSSWPYINRRWLSSSSWRFWKLWLGVYLTTKFFRPEYPGTEESAQEAKTPAFGG